MLTILYQYYLSQFTIKENEVDGFTNSLANQTKSLLNLYSNVAYTMPNLSEPSIKIIYKEKYISRIIEGCNAASVMILFIAFIVAFSGKLKHTILYSILGCIIIHVLNVIRIALLTVALYHYPQYEHILHGVIFPLVIYGVVFILWLIWVNKFSLYASKASTK